MINFDDHAFCISELTAAQNAEKDQRRRAHEAQAFIQDRDGQWEEQWARVCDNAKRPRYTFDMTSPILDQITGELELADFSVKIAPANGDADDDIAKTLDGMVRNIENVSNAQRTYSHAATKMTMTGASGWRLIQRYADADSFNQDLMIDPVTNYLDRVWFDSAAQSVTMRDARFGWLLTSMNPEEYKDTFPKGSGQSVSRDSTGRDILEGNKPAEIVVGEYFFSKTESRTLVQLPDGSVVVETEENADGILAMEEQLEQEFPRRNRPRVVFYVRKFDGGGFLDKARRTVFDRVPIIPAYANFDIFENKITYHGAVEKLIDPQRVLNYSLSREIEEGALAPRAKYWGTPAQRAGFESEIEQLNTSMSSWQDYNPDPAVPGPPQIQGGPQINPGLRVISEAMRGMMGQTAGLFAANMGDNPNAQSGIAIKRLQDKGDRGTIKFTKALEIAIGETGRTLVEAIPQVYDTARQVRIIGQDGAASMTQVNAPTNEGPLKNDLSRGKYDVVCSAGPSFKSKQEETVQAMLELASVMPEVLQRGADVFLKSIDAPGIDLMAERFRDVLMQQGMIPMDQMTDEEKQKAIEAAQKAMQEGPPEDPNMVLAQAEKTKAQADLIAQQNKQMEVQLDAQRVGLEGERLKLDREKVTGAGEIARLKAELEAIRTQSTTQKDEAQTDKITVETATLAAKLAEESRELAEDGRVESVAIIS